MKIYRNGKEIVLTDEEIMEAHAEHIKSFMRNELITVYGLPEEEAEDYAELAYSHYTSGNGYTEYDCIEWAVTIYDLPNLELEDSYLLLWPKGTKKFFSSLDDAVFAAATKVSCLLGMQYIPVTPNMRDYNLLDSLGVAPDLERILDYAMLYGATYVELTGNDADIDPLLPTFKWTLDNDILYAILKDGEQMATYFAIGIDFPCHCIVPANFVLGSSDFSSCIEDTLRRIASLYPESTTAELYANMGAVPDEKIPEGEEDNWVPVDLGYSIPEILRIENSPKPPLYFKVNPHYEDTLAFKMPYFDMDYLEKHVRPEFDEISEIIPISPEDYQKSIKYEDVCTSARN